MKIRQLTTSEELKQYATWLHAHPKRSLWQSLEWKQLQEALGKEVRVYVAESAGEMHVTALVVIDKTSLGLSTWEVPYGPLWHESVTERAVLEFIDALQAEAKSEKCLTLYGNPPAECTFGQLSNRLVYPVASRIINLAQSEEELMAQMKPKGRYNIKVAEKHDVEVRESDDAEAFAALHAKTATRDGFKTGQAKKYQAFLEHLPGSFLLLAYKPNPNPVPDPIAGLLGVIWEDRGIYYYGASDHAHRALMAPYAVQWAAIRHCQQQGCRWYSLFGVAPAGQPNHPWQGITSFKEKFGGQYVEFPAEQQIVLRPMSNALIHLKRKIVG